MQIGTIIKYNNNLYQIVSVEKNHTVGLAIVEHCNDINRGYASIYVRNEELNSCVTPIIAKCKSKRVNEYIPRRMVVMLETHNGNLFVCYKDTKIRISKEECIHDLEVYTKEFTIYDESICDVIDTFPYYTIEELLNNYVSYTQCVEYTSGVHILAY